MSRATALGRMARLGACWAIALLGLTGVTWVAVKGARPTPAPAPPPEVAAWLGVARAAESLRDGDALGAFLTLEDSRESIGDPPLLHDLSRRARWRLGFPETGAPGPEALRVTRLHDAARAALETGDPSAALAAAESFTAAAPETPAALTLLGRAQKAAGDLPGARQALTESLARDRGQVGAMLALAEVHAREGATDLAVQAVRLALRDDPASRQAWNLAARLLSRAGDDSGADRAARRARRLADLNDRVEVARRELVRAGGSGSPWPRVLRALASLHLEAGDAAAAAAHFEALLVLEPDDPDALRGLVAADGALELPTAEEAVRGRLARVLPDHAELDALEGSAGDDAAAWSELGRRLFDDGLPSEAARALQRSAALRAPDRTLSLALAKALLAAGRPECAREALGALLPPSDPESAELLARVELARHHPRDALAAATAALELAPGSATARRLEVISSLKGTSPEASRAIRASARSRGIPAPGSGRSGRHVGFALTGLAVAAHALLAWRTDGRRWWVDGILAGAVGTAAAVGLLAGMPAELRLALLAHAADGLLLAAALAALVVRVAFVRRSAAPAGAGVLLLAALAAAGCSPGPQVERPATSPDVTPPPGAQSGSTGGGAFTDVTSASGIAFVHERGLTGRKMLPETMGSGACFLDHDGDGDVDLYVVQGGPLTGPRRGEGPGNVLYENLGGGRFRDVSAGSGADDRGYGMGCSAADYDGDGDPDLFVTNFGPDVLLRNEGDGTFSDVSAEAGVGDAGWGASSAWGDFDADGDLDLYVVNYLDFRVGDHVPCGGPTPDLWSYCHPDHYDGQPDRLFRNRGDGTFEEVGEAAGISLPEGKGLGVVTLDHDDDGDLDVYVANDSVRNFLFANRGDGTFEEVGIVAGVAYDAEGRSQAGMGVDAGDADGDGDVDLFVTNFRQEYNTLYRNDGAGWFTDATVAAGLGRVSQPYLAFGTAFLDHDGDGLLDLWVANGDIMDDIARIQPGASHAQPDQLLHGLGGGRFEDASATAGEWFSRATVSRGLALGDVDDDGDLDAFVVVSGGRAALLRNDMGPRRARVQLLLEATAGHREAVGARVTVAPRGRAPRQVAEVRRGASYCSQHDPRLAFALGDAESASATVAWGPGRVETLPELEGGFFYLVREAEGVVARRPLRPADPARD